MLSATAAPIASHRSARDPLASTSVASRIDGGGGSAVVRSTTTETRLERVETETTPRLYIFKKK